MKPGPIAWLPVWLLAWTAGWAATPPSTARSPEEERRSFQLADPDLAVELAAAEPDVVSPVAMTWDAAGRLYVAEMRDYPNAADGGSVRRLEDRDGDGRYEAAILFADGLHFPNSVLAWNGGILVTAAPDLWFLRDTDGDGRADERRVLFTGFGAGNQQLRANGLSWGFDGWIYGANGRSDGRVRRPGATNVVSLRGRDYRFRPDTGEFETLAGRSQFGLAFDAWGGRFLSWNTIPLRHEVFPDRYLATHPHVAGRDVLADLLPPGDSGEVFPLTPPPRVFNSESSSHFNALSGLTIYRGTALGSGYQGNAFVGESLRNLVHRRVLEPAGASFVARRTEPRSEFLRSADPWFHPVNFATGPDDTLYVVDFYREFVEHPDFVPREMRDKVPWQVGRGHGRIWRIVQRNPAPGAAGAPPASPRAAAGDPVAKDAAGWVRQLESSNSWLRETAQRLLIEGRRAEMTAALRERTRTARQPVTRFLAGQAWAALTSPEPAMVEVALQDPEPMVRAHALEKVLSLTNKPGAFVTTEIAAGVMAAAADADARVRLRAALALRALPDDGTRERSLKRLREQDPDRWVRLAAIGSSPALTSDQVKALLPGSTQSLRPAPAPAVTDPDRQRVVERYMPATTLAGDRLKGAAVFGRLCLPCHYLQGRGVRVGPDLSGISTRPVEALLVDVLDPSRQVAPEYAAYEVIVADGEPILGLFASETETRMTIRRPGLPDENIPRSRVRSLRPTGKSLMPDGLESGLAVKDLADLLAFLRNPDGALVPASETP